MVGTVVKKEGLQDPLKEGISTLHVKLDLPLKSVSSVEESVECVRKIVSSQLKWLMLNSTQTTQTRRLKIQRKEQDKHLNLQYSKLKIILK